VHRRRSLGEVSVDRSRVGPGLRSPRWAGADTPVHIHRQIHACMYASGRARSCIVHPMHAMHRHDSLECTLCERVYACSTLALAPAPCVSVRTRTTRSRFRSVFARRGASPSVAASRPAKILARSVCSLASLPSFSRRRVAPRRALRGPSLSLSSLPSSSPFATARVPFSPFQSLRRKVPSLAPPYPVPPAGDSALRLHRRATALPREKTSMRNEYRKPLTRIVM